MATNRIFLFHIGLLLFVLTLLGGCVAPGSAIGVLNLNGRIEDYSASDEPLKVRVMLPKEYGLGGLDHVFGKPEDYGNFDRIELKEVDHSGSFTFRSEVVYHITFFLLPPLGIIPKAPPVPIYVVGFSDCPNEVYLVEFKNNAARYKAYLMPQKKELPLDKARWTIFEGSVQEVDIEGRKSLEITLRFKRT
ncbi:MAG: hypothetical protein C4576_13345 [Desulfobacteraceae bacterium]|nr:MAG: hypothetical protein C4576_13345 [Desulfobacteraceae bacterium]